MPEEFQTYQRFPNVTVAQPLLHLLHEHGIEHETKLDQLPIDVSFAFNETSRYFLVQLRPTDFGRARALEREAAETQADEVPADYYLLSFSNSELFDVVLKPDEWNSFDVVLAQRLLQERGESASPALLEELGRQRLEDLARPEPRQTRWVTAGYVLALLGGFFSLLIGWHLYSNYRQLPDGRRVPAFQAPDRVHGLWIMALGAVVIASYLGWWIYVRS